MKKQLFTFTWLSSFCFFHLLLTAWDLWWITSNSALPKINQKKIRTRSTDPNGTYTEEWVAITENFEKLALTTPSRMWRFFWTQWNVIESNVWSKSTLLFPFTSLETKKIFEKQNEVWSNKIMFPIKKTVKENLVNKISEVTKKYNKMFELAQSKQLLLLKNQNFYCWH